MYNSELLLVMIMGNDITERKRVEEEPISEKERLEIVTQNIGAGLAVISRDYRTLWANKVLQDIFGGCVGKVCYSHYNQREEICPGCGVRDIFETGAEKTVHEQVGRDSAGNTIWSQIIATPLRDKGGNITAILELVVPITEYKQAEKALQESEKKYRLLIDTANESVVVAQDGLLKFVNPMTLSLLGADSEQELIDRPFPEFIHLDDRSMVVENYRRRIANEAAKPRYAFRVVALDGSVKWVEINATLIEWQGKPATLNFLTDITERKLAEEALKESEEKYRNLVERANDGITIIQDGIVRYANPATAEIWGGSIEKIVGRPITDFIDPDEIPEVVERYRQRMGNEFVTPIYETILRRRDGTKIFAELNAGLITFQGTPADLVIIRDITERKVVEERLFSLLRFQNKLLDTASIWIDIFDAQGNTTFWNLAAERISGYSREEVLGHAKIWKWLYPDPEYRAKMIDDVTKILRRNERVENFETVIRLKDGGQRVISWHSSNFVDKDSKILGGIGIGVDITEKKEAENAFKESKRRLADIIDFLPDATMVIDKDGMVISWNQAIVDMTGVKAEDILGKGDYEYAIPFYGQRRPVLIDLVQKPLKELEINYSNIKRHGLVLVGEAYMPNLKGGEAYLLGTAAALYDSGGNIVGSIESIRDITEHKRAEEAFKAERDKAEQYLNTVEVIIVVLDADARITLLNRKGYQVLGYEDGELMGRDWIKTCLHPQDHESVYEANRKIIAGEIDLFEYYESYILNKKGEERFIAWHTTIIKDGEGRIIGTLSSGEDITERRKTEEKNLQLAAIVESSNDAIFGALLDGTITNWNKGSERIYGYAEDEIIGQPVTILVSPERLDEVLQILERLRQGEHIDHHESLCRRKDGEQFSVDLTISPIYDIKGRIIGTSSIVRDITEHKQAEEALKESEQLFSSLVQHSAIATFVVDPEHKVLNWNKACEELTGVRAEEVVGTSNHWQAFYAKHRPCLADLIIDNKTEIMHELYEIHAKSKLIPNGLHAEGWYPGLGGKDRYILFDAAPIYGINGKLAAAIETLQDITERKLAEEELRKTRNYLENLIDYANAPIIVWDPSFSITRFNHAFERLTGLKADEVLGEPLATLFPESSREESTAYIKRTLSGEHWEVVEIPILSADGSVRTVLWNSANIQDKGGKIIATIAQGTDITEHKRIEEKLRQSRNELEQRVKERTEELARKNAEMERFIYTVSHDLRTPLISVSGFLGFLQQDSEKGDHKRMDNDLQIIGDAISKMDKLLSDTLELSRIGRIVDIPKNVPFREIAWEALEQIEETLKTRGVKVSVIKDLVVVHVDKMRLTEVLVNLLENSVKYLGDQPEPCIEVDYRMDGSETIFFVRDNGIGIDPSQHERVFELFYKLDKMSEGTGAGLAIVKRIIEAHGGRIWIESELGRGCTVCFTLPLANYQ